MQPIKKVEFIKWLTETSRMRHCHFQIKNQVIEFMVQLEEKIEGKWYPVVRYDTKHGFAHKDICHFNDTVEKFNLGAGNYNIAMTFAEQELKSRGAGFIKEFLEEVKKYDR